MASFLQRQDSVEDKYAFIKHLGNGSYGDVWIVVPLDKIGKGTRYVMKRINIQLTTHSTLKAAEQEARFLSTLQHPNIVRYIDCFQSWDSYLNIVMNYCEGGDLNTKINQKKSDGQMFEEAKIIEWCIQICMALEHLHEHNVLHRDLKTKNIFLTKSEVVKVGDFGISRALSGAHDLATTIVGTPYYMSPEMFSQRPYNHKSDIWAFGCCMFELVNLDYAFKATDLNSLMVKVTRGDIPKIRGNYSNELKSLMKSMLSVEPDDRPTANEILNNEYIKNHIMQMVVDFKQRVENTPQKKGRKKRSHSTVPLESELKNLSPKDGFETANLIDSYSSESHTPPRQKIAAQKMSKSDNMAKPTAAFASHANSAASNADELQNLERCPIEKLTHYFKQYEHQNEHDEGDSAVPAKDQFIITTNSSPGVISRTEYRPPTSGTTLLCNQDQSEPKYRYSDIGNLPDQILLPITDYEKEPLRSLEDSIRPVSHLLATSFDAGIKVAKANAQKRHGLLSVDESAAIQLYTMEMLPVTSCLYYILNKTLRSAKRRDLVPWFPYLKLLLTALWKLPSFEGVIWRGVKGIDLSEQYEAEECYTWWNLSSCTQAVDVMEKEQFMGTEGVRTLFSIQCFNGKEIKQHSYVPAENEILLPPATYFKVLGKVDAGAGLRIIHVREILPPYELISPPF